MTCVTRCVAGKCQSRNELDDVDSRLQARVHKSADHSMHTIVRTTACTLESADHSIYTRECGPQHVH